MIENTVTNNNFFIQAAGPNLKVPNNKVFIGQDLSVFGDLTITTPSGDAEVVGTWNPVSNTIDPVATDDDEEDEEEQE